MKTRTLVIGMLLLAIVLAPVTFGADEPARRGPSGQGAPGGRPRPGAGGYGGPRGGMMGTPRMGDGDLGRLLLSRFGEQLKLTDEQKKQIKEVVDSNKDETQKLGMAVREALQTLNKATQDGEKDGIIAAGKSVGEAYTQQALQRAATANQIKEVLTDEQQAQLKELRSKMQERMMNRRQGQTPMRRPERQSGPGQGRGGRPERVKKDQPADE